MQVVLFPGKKHDAFREGYARLQATLDQYRHRFFCWTDGLKSEMCFPDPGGPVHGLFRGANAMGFRGAAAGQVPFGEQVSCRCEKKCYVVNCPGTVPLYVHIAGDVQEGQKLATDEEGRAVPAGPDEVIVAVAEKVIRPHPRGPQHPPGAYISWAV